MCRASETEPASAVNNCFWLSGSFLEKPGVNDYTGWVKIVTDKKYGEILGAHLIGPEVTELLPDLTLAQANELTAAEIAYNIHAHPTLSEVVHEAATDVFGEAVHG
jgi:dihydrolipoamide dehydrogenase